MKIDKLSNVEWLRTQYIDMERSCDDIATELGTYRHRVRRALIKMRIPLRNPSAAQSVALKTERASHPTKGKRRPESVRVCISEGVAKSWSELSEEEILERSMKSKEQWNNMSQYDKDKLQNMALAAVLRTAKEGSKLEKFIFDRLTSAGYVIEYHKSGLLPSEKLQIDLYLPELGTAIEIDGPNHFLPIWGAEQLRRTIQSDQKKTGLLLSFGLVILRIKCIHKSISKKLERDILHVILEQLDKIKIEYPDKTKRLIEIEV